MVQQLIYQALRIDFGVTSCLFLIDLFQEDPSAVYAEDGPTLVCSLYIVEWNR